MTTYHKMGVVRVTGPIFSERELRYMLSPVRLSSVCCLSVCCL